MFRTLNLTVVAAAATALMASTAMARDLVINFDDLNPGPKAAFEAGKNAAAVASGFSK